MIHMQRGLREIHILSNQELLIVVSGLAALEMAMESSSGRMVQDTKVNGKIIEHTVKASLLI